MKLTINMRTVPHDKQRYDTAGDWSYSKDDDHLIITVWASDSGSVHSTFLLMMHEVVEAYLAWQRGISPEAVTAWDVAYTGEGEPGDGALCPYREAHQYAEVIERMLAAMIPVDWNGYIAHLAHLTQVTQADAVLTQEDPCSLPSPSTPS